MSAIHGYTLLDFILHGNHTKLVHYKMEHHANIQAVLIMLPIHVKRVEELTVYQSK